MKTQQEIEARLNELQNTDGAANFDWPDSTELLRWVLAPSPVVHEGADKDRCNHRSPGWFNREKLFADKWLETNAPPAFMNGGRGTLEWLLCTQFTKDELGNHQRFYRHLTQPEATAAASAIQWLGTNCGWCWLEECIRACGCDIVQRRKGA